MNFTFGGFVASMLVSGAGFVFFRFGKKRGRTPFLITGILLMVYPYFIDDTILMLSIGGILCLLLFLATKMGY